MTPFLQFDHWLILMVMLFCASIIKTGLSLHRFAIAAGITSYITWSLESLSDFDQSGVFVIFSFIAVGYQTIYAKKNTRSIL